MLNLAFIYIILIFLVLRFSVTLFNFLSNPKLGKYKKHFSSKVSVIIQVTTDSYSLIKLLTALKGHDYQNIEVIVTQPVKLKSSAELRAICDSDPRFQLRKRNSFTIEDATGDYLLFLEPQVIIHDGLINSLIYRVKVFNLTLLNIIPMASPSGLMNHILLPLNSFVLFNLIPLRLVRLFSSPVFAAGSSECMFFEAATYKEYNWQEKVNKRIPEAVDVVRAVKEEGLKAETLIGHKLISLPAPAQTNRLFSKTAAQLLKAFGDNVFGALLYVLLVVTGPLVMFLNYEYSLLILPVGLIFLSRLMISFLSGQNPFWNVLLHPVQMVFLLAAVIRETYLRSRRLIKTRFV
ncbi:glycosyltransferase family 2 protein [Pedobacter sp. MC2016-15]|uniref:glycosyltransferase family 2 protein n=1 Tax=Pedobacter sp. MC2016-15 TaxID=2994473 RepID=UPI00224687DE|nr:glycosyltransferase family 2 protein [Pedobacter sp. MC2016-15]MCX2480871.1 glycosyltransferase family 2 protein [Pedobacter sp. MC2016-15]